MSTIRKAFTLIELLITVSILTLVGAFIIPNYQLILTQLQLTSATQQVVDLLRYNAQRTVTEQIPYGTILTANATTIPLYKCTDGTCATTQSLTSYTFPTNIKIGGVSFSGQSDIRFATSGAPNYSGTLTITDMSRNRSRNILVRPSGTVLMSGGEF